MSLETKMLNPLYRLRKPASCTEYKLYHDENKFIKDNPLLLSKIYEFHYYRQNEYKSLPSWGWIKPCISCMSNTGKTVIYRYPLKYRYRYFRLYICKDCYKKHKDSTDSIDLLERIKIYSKTYIDKNRFSVLTKMF